MITFTPGLTFQEQITFWLNSSNSEEYKIAKYIEEMVDALQDEDSPAYQKGYDRGYDSGYEAGECDGYRSGYSDGMDHPNN